MYSYRYLDATSDCVDNFVFVVAMQFIFVFERFKQIKYIKLETINKISGCQYAIKYSNYDSNIKHIDSTINCIGFELIHYTININVVLSFMIFSDFDYMFSIVSLNQ